MVKSAYHLEFFFQNIFSKSSKKISFLIQFYLYLFFKILKKISEKNRKIMMSIDFTTKETRFLFEYLKLLFFTQNKNV
jgi:hypothetical protein